MGLRCGSPHVLHFLLTGGFAPLRAHISVWSELHAYSQSPRFRLVLPSVTSLPSKVFFPFRRRRPIAVEASPIAGEASPTDSSADEPLSRMLPSPLLSFLTRPFNSLRRIMVLCFQLIPDSRVLPVLQRLVISRVGLCSELVAPTKFWVLYSFLGIRFLPLYGTRFCFQVCCHAIFVSV
jgi:hypothetical protein